MDFDGLRTLLLKEMDEKIEASWDILSRLRDGDESAVLLAKHWLDPDPRSEVAKALAQWENRKPN